MKNRDTIYKILKAVIRNTLGLPEDEDLQFTTAIIDDLGADSLDTVELVLAIEEEFDIEIEDDEATEVVTVGDAVRLVSSKLSYKNISILRYHGWDGKRRRSNIFYNSYPLKDKIIILNAPKKAGKDTVADYISKMTDCVHTRFKEHLYQCTATLFNVDLDWFKQVAQDTELKEQPNKLLTLSSENFTKLCNITKDNRAFTVDDNWNVHISPREALIFTSEIVIKPIMGEEYFGQQACGYVDMDQGTIFSDGGFQEELLPLILKYGQGNIYVVQFIRKDSESFEGDSRNWLDVDVLLQDKNVLVTENNGTIQELAAEILEFVTK